MKRRALLHAGAGIGLAPLLGCANAGNKIAGDIRITGFELLPVRATYRTVWLFLRLHTSTGLSGIGEASDAFGFANTTRTNTDTMHCELAEFFAMVVGESPLAIQQYRERGRARAESASYPPRLIRPSSSAYGTCRASCWTYRCMH